MNRNNKVDRPDSLLLHRPLAILPIEENLRRHPDHHRVERLGPATQEHLTPNLACPQTRNRRAPNSHERPCRAHHHPPTKGPHRPHSRGERPRLKLEDQESPNHSSNNAPKEPPVPPGSHHRCPIPLI
ncbi:unnamed protein product [Caenorhabditis nigoni]